MSCIKFKYIGFLSWITLRRLHDDVTLQIYTLPLFTNHHKKLFITRASSPLLQVRRSSLGRRRRGRCCRRRPRVSPSDGGDPFAASSVEDERSRVTRPIHAAVAGPATGARR